MANDLTGDFDIVAEFAIPAANRVLAAMHRAERFLHSVSLRVDDTPPPFHGGAVGQPTTAVASLDGFGSPTTDHNHIADVTAAGTLTFLTPASRFGLDAIVNVDLAGISIPPFEPSHLKGKAQIQVFPPTVTIPDASGTRLTVRMQFIARYFPDKDTLPLAEYIHGELQLTAPLTQVASQVGRVLQINVKANNVTVGFTPIFTSRPLSAQDIGSIGLAIKNAIRTSFLPSSATLPDSVGHLQVKTLQGGQGALAVLLNMSGGVGNPATVNHVFLGAGDHFAFGAGLDFIRAAFQPTLDNILTQTIPPVKFDVDTWVHTFHITYDVTLKSASMELETGAIVLEIKGHAHTGTSWMPDFDFTVRQEFTLDPDGATANLVVGELSFDTDSWVADRFKGAAQGKLESMRNRALNQSGAVSTVRKKLDANENLGKLLSSLFESKQQGAPPTPPGSVRLAYTTIEIRQSGIVLHGSVSVPEFPAPYVEFEQIQSSNSLAGDLTSIGPTYTALKSWIPGGTIERFEWKRLGPGQPVTAETHRFVFQQQLVIADDTTAAALAPLEGYHPMCLTVRGSRLSASGPIAAQAVSGTSCGFTSFPISIDTATIDALPLVALTQPGPRGTLQIAGHAPVRHDPTGSVAPNLIVHFADDRSVGQLDTLAEGLRASGRKDAATAILAVLTPDQLKKARFVEGVSFAEDQGGAWERLFGVTVGRRPTTMIVSPRGRMVWRHEGEIDRGRLAGALRTELRARKRLTRGVVPSGVRLGQPPPNILFEHAPGHELTLRKLAGRPATLVFWKSASTPSLEAVSHAQKIAVGRRARPSVVLAINDGDPIELAQKLAAGHGFADILVLDPKRTISQAYGVNIWPTVVHVDSSGVVNRVNVGGDHAADGAADE